MKTFIAVLALATVALATPLAHRSPKLKVKEALLDPVLPAPEHNGGRIVGGVESVPNAHPFAVNLHIDNYLCTGIFVAPNAVLTAGHCTTSAKKAVVIFGAHDHTNENEPTQKRVESVEFITHEDYDGSKILHDLGVIVLPEDMEEVAGTIEMIALTDDKAKPEEGRKVRSIGWGKPSDGFFVGASDVLREVETTVGNFAKCSATYGGIDEGDFCLDTTGGHGTCNGDSGGPTVTTEGEEVLLGVTSFGASAGCEKGYPVGLVSVAEYRDWICDNIPNAKGC